MYPSRFTGGRDILVFYTRVKVVRGAGAAVRNSDLLVVSWIVNSYCGVVRPPKIVHRI
jgi:hypothetical protein